VEEDFEKEFIERLGIQESSLQKEDFKSDFEFVPSAQGSELAPISRIPLDPKPGYKTVPSIQELARMTLTQLQNVENFSIENKFGKIEWPGATDLTDLDLGELVTITARNAEVYNEEKHEKPSIGQKLNK